MRQLPKVGDTLVSLNVRKVVVPVFDRIGTASYRCGLCWTASEACPNCKASTAFANDNASRIPRK
jgi:hypothetical protein